MSAHDRIQARDHAHHSLRAAEDGERRLLAALVYGRAAPFLILWGLIWAAGFTSAVWAPDHAAPAWSAVVALGWAATVALVLAQRRRDRERGFGAGARYGASAALMSAYAGLWAVVLLSGHPNAHGIYAGTVTGFAYLVAGLWRGRLLVGLGVAVTLLFAAGFAVPSPQFPLYAGLIGGGGLIAAGLVLARRDPT
ncbi:MULTISPECIES: hypothetical protein [Methylobacteriaceae]|uniref:hypothetical protein n=1 Tax=Methylobacteriaceae TaxID=119045 RepID=UPI00074F9C0D|nr:MULTISPECIES: hypothetical protein [Methylobacteriaceae]AMB45757.1 hypothetical protein Y590_12640 [Methylobacterium sp. AMS5]TFZ57385.1 hypothetical protein E4V01_15750 [Methylorubrum sp. Q1]